ncbi:16S rRNA (cytosine(1402)-N(4))-methyltransferase RsmH [Methylonatrum kenyense]|uniref:16S rRNA (cytosine(1402)-N(4))-methyltransferase RsmH n=1 Tax=Methylonatrum kenyense TaxID=455253 RepID=UPI0020C0C315|nr:16S rRNA (cytosine(1402)-N(4))-methyltransferase RsmH [Methylonatrum kenyense]
MTTGEASGHESVFLKEAVEGLAVRADGFYIDGTYGRGGHAAAILRRLGSSGRLWLIDRDPEAIAHARVHFGDDPRCRIVDASFRALDDVLAEAGAEGRLDGLLLDLGVSSPQLDEPRRGFSFMRDGPLDMRMDTTHGPTAREWLQQVDEQELVRVLRVYGEERFARRIATAIRIARDEDALPSTTLGLAELVSAAIPRRDRHKHPATRTFQAVRIAVNGELDALEVVLQQAPNWLRVGGRLVVISFHSLEDRMVKRAMRGARAATDLPPGIPVAQPPTGPSLRAVGKPLFGDRHDIENPRARSAVLRVAERAA